MAIKKNTALRNNELNNMASLFSGGTLEIRTGSQPASANDAATGTLLVSITLPSPAFSAAASGSITKTGVWSATAVNSGLAGWARLKSSDGTFVRDFSVNMSGGDLTIDDTSITSGMTVTVVSLTITASGA